MFDNMAPSKCAFDRAKYRFGYGGVHFGKGEEGDNRRQLNGDFRN